MPINILTDFQVSIRPCELNNYASLFGQKLKMTVAHSEYIGMMMYLTNSGASLLDIVLSSKAEYDRIKTIMFGRSKVHYFETILDESRKLIMDERPGSNVVRYLLHTLKNKIIKQQRNDTGVWKLSNLYLKWGCIPFDTMPFASSLIQHNPEWSDLSGSVSSEGRNHELMVRYIHDNMSVNSRLYTSIKELKDLAEDIDLHIETFNTKLYSAHTGRRIKKFGSQDYCYKYDGKKKEYVQIESLPDYSAMLTGECVEITQEELPERIPFENLEKELQATFSEDDDSYYTDISKYTPMELALPVFNLWEGLLDVRVKMPAGKYGLFELLEDYGVRMLTYGNAAGGQFYGPYRSFLVSIDGNTEIFSIGLATYWKASWVDKNGNMMPDKHPLTCICVAHDDEKTSHHALQLLVDEDAVANGKTVSFYHNGRIAIGRIGSGKKSELHELVKERYPKIIEGDKYYLGSITADHLLRLDEPDVVDLIENLISYSIVRDEFREIVKSRK